MQLSLKQKWDNSKLKYNELYFNVYIHYDGNVLEN